jgi:hypothetical protein
MIDHYKSRLSTVETPRNHNLSQHQIVFAIVEKYVGIVMTFLISKNRLSFQSTLKVHKNHDLNHFAPTYILLRRLCLQPPDPCTIEKLRLSAYSVLLVLGVNLGSLLTKSCQSYDIGS